MSSDRIGLDQVLVRREVDEAELAAVAFLARDSGRTTSSQRPVPTSSCSAITWNIAGSLRRRSIDVSRRCVACTASRTSTVGSARTRPSTYGARRCIRARATGWTAPSSAGPRTTTIYDRRRENFDRHAAYIVVAFVAGA